MPLQDYRLCSSKWLEVEISKDGKIYYQRYENGGHKLEALKVIGECDIEKTGTKVTFMPDDEIFDETIFDFDTLKNRFREMDRLKDNCSVLKGGILL